MFHRPVLALALVALLAMGVSASDEPADSGAPADQANTDRWYEILRRGQKLGHTRVVWAPSTWEGRPTVHDTTTVTRKSVRTMLGIRDVFETSTSIDLERGADGTLWWMKVVVEEAGRSTVIETTWTGDGYEYVTKIGDVEQIVEIPLDTPVAVDAEAFLGQRIREGKVKVGDRFDMRVLDVEARGAHVDAVEVLAREDVVDRAAGTDGETIRVPCFKVRDRDPRSGEATLLWIDDDGAFVKIATEGGVAYRRVGREVAEAAPVKPAEFGVTTPSTPVLERVMSADRLLLDLHLQGDPDRPLPEYPESPWSRVLDVEGSDDDGWVVKLQLDRHDDKEAQASLPIDAERFARHLESTALMPCRHETIQNVVHEVVGDEKDVRTAAELLAQWVFTKLTKQSPDVAQASALQILEEGRGDCSEHALLFITLCRGAGIPAKHCSGYVNIGAQWGAHAWAEIWVGAWIGADPTTGEVGTAARYVFFGYDDDPESFPGVVSARSQGRMRFVATRIDEGQASYDLRERVDWHRRDAERGNYLHVLAGLEVREAPEGWMVTTVGTNRMFIRGDDLRADVRADADQGFSLTQIGGGSDRFCGIPARRIPLPKTGVAFMLNSRRRMIQVVIRTKDVEGQLPLIEKALQPTFAETPLPWPEKGDESSEDDQDE